MDKSKIKVCVGLSGGVDSSVAAYLLKQEGYDVFAMFMQNWHDADSTLHGDCEWEEDRFVAEMVARKIGIPFYFVDLSAKYRQRVVDYMFDEYAKGRTPNPDVLCNREIKFDAFMEVALKYGADFVATGHYVRKEEIPGQAVTYRILEGTDPNKDQSYFLCQLSQEQLSRAVFPIGHLTKPQVRQIAKEADLPSAEKKDSQGICFVGKVDLPTFLKQKLASVEGDIVEVFDAWYAQDGLYNEQQTLLGSLLKPGTDLDRTVHYAPEEKVLTSDGKPLGECPFQGLDGLSEDQLKMLSTPLSYDIKFETETYRSGKRHIKKTRWKANPYGVIAGRHEGAQFYTIGQRKGLGVGGHADPVFVIATDTEKNIVYVGEGHNHKGLSRFCLRIAREDIHWVRPDLALREGESARLRVRIRYRQPLQSATLLMRESGLYILFDAPQRGISPGQFAVWYTEDEMIGSGVIQ
jgi:tRNA-specific 2-thiouridylase